MPSLLDPIELGAIHAPNRILMAPLTRGRATYDHVPTPMMAEYYTQRAGAGLIISEATGISLQGLGWPYAPGLWSKEQVEGWKPVTKSLHDAGGRIVAQLWHMGRVVHSSMPDRSQPVSASTTTAPGHAHTYEGNQPHVEARPLRIDEIPGLLDDYRNAARNAIEAGFDGVQIHAANGYLIDQFLRDKSNFREDDYGGSIENRTRLLREITQAVADTIGPDRTAVRLSPTGEIQGVDDSDPAALFGAAASVLSEIGIAFLELREMADFRAQGTAIAPVMRTAFKGPFVLNGEYDPETAQAALDAGKADAIAFGRPFIANPDLPRRIAEELALNTAEPETFYSQGPKGYIDYPAITD
jgi:2,4-dienoyl-CoA reductase-like NADH-dependent reductase (Old Yellow Enzyme family)